MGKHDYDLFVIGAGSGGVRAGRIAAGYGAKVAIAEEWRVGGTCVLRGCIPMKLFVHASHFAEAFEDSVGFGWRAEDLNSAGACGNAARADGRRGAQHLSYLADRLAALISEVAATPLTILR